MSTSRGGPTRSTCQSRRCGHIKHRPGVGSGSGSGNDLPVLRRRRLVVAHQLNVVLSGVVAISVCIIIIISRRVTVMTVIFIVVVIVFRFSVSPSLSLFVSYSAQLQTIP